MADFRRVSRHEIVAGNAETGIRLNLAVAICYWREPGLRSELTVHQSGMPVYRNERGRQTEREGNERRLFMPRPD